MYFDVAAASLGKSSGVSSCASVFGRGSNVDKERFKAPRCFVVTLFVLAALNELKHVAGLSISNTWALFWAGLVSPGGLGVTRKVVLVIRKSKIWFIFGKHPYLFFCGSHQEVLKKEGL